MNPDRGIAIACLESQNGCWDNPSGYLDVEMGCLKNQNQAPGPSKDIEKHFEITVSNHRNKRQQVHPVCPRRVLNFLSSNKT